ncbi:RNA-directed DNA polymerase, eukaryota [Tanacetum coccineum]
MGVDDWHEVTRKKSGFRTKEDDLAKVSISIYVTNFPDSCSAKDLFHLCEVYGHVVDSYIPLKRSKSGKRFGFVKFINVFSVERLVNNLCTLWSGKFRLHANISRFQRSHVYANVSTPSGGNVNKEDKVLFTRNHKPLNQSRNSSQLPNPGMIYAHTGPYASVVKEGHNSLPALVLDESCVVSRDLDFFVMGEAKNFLSIPNLYNLLSNEGFHNVKLNRIVWVDIEGVPIHAWSRATFNKIGSKWGQVMEIEECKDDLFARKRICIKTSQEDNILERFKIIVKGKVFVIRAKELFVWSPNFKVDNEAIFFSDAESSKSSGIGKGDNIDKGMESDGEVVSDTYFGENTGNLNKEQEQVNSPNMVAPSTDPFNIYETLRNHKSEKVLHNETEPSIPFPPGFTPRNETLNLDDQSANDKCPNSSQRQSVGLNSRVMEDIHQDVDQIFSGNNSTGSKERVSRKGGSILEVLDDMVKVGQAMGYDMDGCLKDMEKIIGFQGVSEVIR